MKKKDQVLHHGRMFHCVDRQGPTIDGLVYRYHVLEHPGAVCALALDEDDNLWLVQQYRYGTQSTTLELPAGKLELGEQEDLKTAIRRELEEEIGQLFTEVQYFGEMDVAPAYSSERITCFIARGAQEVGQKLDIDEQIEVVKLPVTVAIDMVLNGEITDSKTAYFLLRYGYQYGRKNGNRI